MKTNNEYTKEYQNITLMTAVAANEYWSINDVNTLRELKKANISNIEIAQALGRSYFAVSTKFSLIGLDGDISVMFGHRSRNAAPVSYGEVCEKCFCFHSVKQVDCA